jgi:hypothetical protein
MAREGSSLRTTDRWVFIAVLSMGCDPLDGGDEGSSSSADDIAIWSSEPDVGACVSGSLTPEYQQRIVGRLNQLRLLHELPLVTIGATDREATQEAALLAVANAELTHHPSTDAFCYSADAGQASADSLLFLTAGNQVGNIRDPDRFFVDWLLDVDVPSLGHRRWLLDPFLSEVTFGLVQGTPHVDFPYKPVVGAALDVVGGADVDLGWWPNDFVAYPYGLYPAEFVDDGWLFSFSVIADHTTRLGSVDKVSFEGASVEITDDAGGALGVRDIFGAYDLTGVPNALSFRVDGVKLGVSYDVKVAGVTVDGEPREYEYDFLLMP